MSLGLQKHIKTSKPQPLLSPAHVPWITTYALQSNSTCLSVRLTALLSTLFPSISIVWCEALADQIPLIYLLWKSTPFIFQEKQPSCPRKCHHSVPSSDSPTTTHDFITFEPSHLSTSGVFGSEVPVYPFAYRLTCRLLTHSIFIIQRFLVVPAYKNYAYILCIIYSPKRPQGVGGWRTHQKKKF